MPPARATLPPTPGLCKSSRPPAPSVLLPWRAVLLSAPSKHCARRRLLAHTPKAAGQRAGSPLPALSPPPSPLPGGRCSSAKGRPAALAGNRTRVNCLEGSYAHHYTTNATQPGRPPDAGPGLAPAYSRRRRRRRRPRRRIPAPTPRQPEALRRRRRHQQPRGAPCASALRRGRGPPARRPCGPAALRSPPRPANASALTSGGQRGARSFPHPAGQSPSPPGSGRGHFPRRLGDTGPSCLHASRRCAEPHGGGVASLGAHRGSRWGWVRGRPGGPAGRKLRLWSGKAVGWPRRPSLGRGDRAPGDHKGLGERGSTVARPRTAPWRLAQRRRDQTKGLWGPGGRTESDRGHQKGCVASPSGNRTPVSRVTGGDTHHYTNEDGGDRPTARPLTGSRAACRRVPLPSTGPRPPRVPTQPRTQPTAPFTAAARHPDRAPDHRGSRPHRAPYCNVQLRWECDTVGPRACLYHRLWDPWAACVACEAFHQESLAKLYLLVTSTDRNATQALLLTFGVKSDLCLQFCL